MTRQKSINAHKQALKLELTECVMPQQCQNSRKKQQQHRRERRYICTASLEIYTKMTKEFYSMKLWVLHKPSVLSMTLCVMLSFDLVRCLSAALFLLLLQHWNKTDDRKKLFGCFCIASIPLAHLLYFVGFCFKPFFISVKLLINSQHRYFMWCDYCCWVALPLASCNGFFHREILAFKKRSVKFMADIVRFGLMENRFVRTKIASEYDLRAIETFLCFQRG